MITAAQLAEMSRAELDALPYGAIRLSPFGTVLSYNATEARLAGRVPEQVLGRNFFRDVAPCTDVQEFHGQFTSLVRGGRSIFHEFSFDFPFDPPLRVHITFLRDRGDDSVWVLIEPSDEA